MIILLQEHDLERVLDLVNTAEYLNESDTALIKQAFINKNCGERWIGYEISGRLSGLAFVSRTEELRKSWAIKFLYVRPDMRGFGVSKTIIRYIKMELENWNTNSVLASENVARDYCKFFKRWGYIYL